MRESALLIVAMFLSVGGLAWLALAMEVHWQQARGTEAPPGRATAICLRVLGALAVLASLAVCLRADHPSMAVLVWVMSLAAAAVLVAFTLAWRPRWLAWWVVWAGRGG